MASGMSATPGEQKEATAGEDEGGAQAKDRSAHETEGTNSRGEGESSEGKHGEKYFRTRSSDLRAQLELHQRQLKVLSQKLDQNEMQFYSDPNKMLQQQYSRSDVNKLTQEIQQKREEIAADEEAIEDLRTQLRREGGDPGWLR